MRWPSHLSTPRLVGRRSNTTSLDATGNAALDLGSPRAIRPRRVAWLFAAYQESGLQPASRQSADDGGRADSSAIDASATLQSSCRRGVMTTSPTSPG